LGTSPISTTTRLHAGHGRYVILQYPNSHPARPKILACIADAGLYRSVASNLEAWRSVNLGLGGFEGHAAGRLSLSVTRLRGKQHAHYRRLLALPLSKPAVAGMSADMAAIAQRNVEAWPRNEVTNLVPLASDLMQDFAIGLLFGNDRARALPIGRMIGDGVAAAWPFPGPAFFKWLRVAPKLELAIRQWGAEKRGELDPRDIFSILMNNTDENGEPPSMEVIAGILVFTFGAGYDTCQNALAWTMVLLAQHPQIAADLGDEIDGALAGGGPAMKKLATLPLLDDVIKESMRLFPPVPLQFRRSLVETELGGREFPPGCGC
jgi:cytochrome P450